jgi:MerR family transcriptional regulator, heat shock protein HspR
MTSSPDPARGVYGISIAADLAGLGVQTLRLYEQRGLLTPDRTDGGTRLYSSDDLGRLRRITDLLDAGLNLAGIALVLQLEAENAALRAQLDAPRPQDEDATAARTTSRATKARPAKGKAKRTSPRGSTR